MQVDSMKVVQALKAKMAQAGQQPRVVVNVGYTQKYALKVHEDRKARHRVGRAGYLLDVARKFAREVGRVVREAFAQTKRLDQALLLGGLRIQRESQLQVPVDTSALKASGFTALEMDMGPAQAAFAKSEAIRKAAGTGTFTHTAAKGLSVGDGTAGAGNVAIKFVAGMTYSRGAANSFWTLLTTAANQTIATAGNTLGNMQLNASGSWQLSDNLTIESGSTLTVTQGTLDLNGFNLSVGTLSSSGTGTRGITCGSSTVSITGSAIGTHVNFTTPTNLTFSGSSATFNLTDTDASAKTFAGGGQTFGTVNISAGGAGAWTFSGNNTFTKINRSGTGTKTVKFTAGSTTTLTGGTDAFISGSAGNVWTLQSTAGGSAWNLSKASGTVDCSYISLQDSAAAGGATFNAGTGSTNVSGNSGWVFASAGVDAALIVALTRRGLHGRR